MAKSNEITYRQVKEKQAEDLKSKTSRYMIYRKLSTPLTYLFVKLGVSPAAISIINFMPPLIGFYLLSLGSYISMAIGLLSFALFKVLDCSDGEVARIQNPNAMEEMHKGIEGPFLDGVGHYIYPICLGMGLGIGIFRLYSNEIYLILGVVLTLLFVQEVALIELLKSYYRKAIIGRKIKASDKETLQKIMDELHNGKTWEGQDFFVKLFSMYPFQGLLYTTEFIIPVLIALVILEPAITPEITKISIVTIYLGIIALQKLVHFISFIWKIKKSMFITKAIERMQIESHSNFKN